jgi:hypothetical protein
MSTDYTKLDPDRIIGYTIGAYARIYDPAVNKFININRPQLNRQTNYHENGVIVMLLDSSIDGTIKIKLRKPVETIKKNLVADLAKRREELVSSNNKMSKNVAIDNRLIEKGFVCSTAKKGYLADILTSLGGKVNVDRIDNLCSDIRETLVVEEVRARSAKNNNTKYVYGWWDEQVAITM